MKDRLNPAERKALRDANEREVFRMHLDYFCISIVVGGGIAGILAMLFVLIFGS